VTTRNLVALVLFVIAGLPLIGNAWWQYRQDKQRGEQDRDELLALVSKDVAQELQGVLDGMLEDARADGGLPGLGERVLAPPDDRMDRLLANRFLTAIGSRDPLNITSVGLLDLAGRVRADTVAGEVGRDESAEPYFTAALETGTAQLHGPHRRADGRRPGLFVAAPLRDALNTPVGVLRIRVEPALVAQILEDNLRLHGTLGASVLAADGQAFAHAGRDLDAEPGTLAAASRAQTLPGADGLPAARAVVRALPRAGWQLLVYEPHEFSQQRLSAKFNRWIGYLLLLASLLIAAALSIGWLLSRPLVRLTEGVDRIAAGDLQQRVQPAGSLELRHLGEAVNAMNARLAANMAELQGMTDALEQRVQQRTAELEHSSRQLSLAMDQLVQSEKLASLGSLVAGVAHELNTPIGNALTAATALQSQLHRFSADVAAGPLRRSQLTRMIEEGDEAASLIERNLHRAAELIGNFKQVAVDQASTRRRRFDLRGTIEDVLSTLNPRLKRLDHTLQLDVPAGLVLDSFPGPLEQVLTNLVCNSLDHAFPADGRGHIRISAAAVDGGRVRLVYEDDGSGIPAELHKRVFDPFFTTRLGHGGSGLGLYLVYSLVTGPLGGSVVLHSAPAAGTRFVLDLPAVAPAGTLPGPAHE